MPSPHAHVRMTSRCGQPRVQHWRPCGCRYRIGNPPAGTRPGRRPSYATDSADRLMAATPGKAAAVELSVGERTVRISNPDRVYFPARGETKLDLARYYLSVGDGIVRALRERPCMMHRFPDGVSGEKVHQKRLPRGAPALGRNRPGGLSVGSARG